ncbi:hypothetical protein [Streptosporangium sp. NPDC051022]|uniref:3'-5' exonuclease n=1 Tax=Streptosporangium sp. NPDC051022 TaxID=3155752 RepID=UPI00343B4466
MTRIVFLDTETTSLDDTRGGVWEIGAIVRDPGQADVEHLWQIWPDLSTSDPNSLRIGRFYERHLLARQPAAPEYAIEVAIDGKTDLLDNQCHTGKVARELAHILDGAHVVGAVPDFDYRFLRRFLATWGQAWSAHYHLIDIEALAVGWLHGKAAALAELKDSGPNWHDEATKTYGLPWDSKALSRALRVDPDQFDQHTALGDARWARALYDAVMGGAA